MDLQLKDKVVVVTGGASGIGAAIVRSVVAECGIAVIVDRCAELAHGLEAELREDGRQGPRSRGGFEPGGEL